MIILRYMLGLLFLQLGSTMCHVATHDWPVRNGTEITVKSLMDIPQTHCLRLLKHDVLRMRRCRNYRIPMQRKAINRN